MKISMRLYKRLDPDLYALFVNGYSVWDIARDAVSAIASGERLLIIQDEPLPMSDDKRDGVQCYIYVGEKDNKAIEMLSHIKYGYKTSFMKSVIREAFLKMPRTEYFEPGTAEGYERAEIAKCKFLFPSARPLSYYKVKPKEKTNEEKPVSVSTPAKPVSAPALVVEKPAQAVPAPVAESVPAPIDTPATVPTPIPSVKPDVPEKPAEAPAPAAVPAEPVETVVGVPSVPSTSETSAPAETTAPTVDADAPADDLHSNDDPNELMAMFENL